MCSRYYQEQSAKDPSFPLTPVVVGGDLGEECLSADVQAKVSTLILMIGVITGFLSAITAPKLGALSDRYGRTRMLVICSLGGIVAEVITILAANFPDVVHYNWLILGAAFDGLTGSFTAGGVIAHAYVSDCTPPSQRNVAFGYLHSCLFLGLSFGPLITGYFVKWTGSLVSLFYLTLGCHLVFIFFVYFVAPESLSKARQRLAREKHEQEEMIRDRRRQDPAWMARVSRSLSWLPFSKPVGRFVYEIRTTNVFAPLKILVPKGPGSSKLRRNLLTLAFVDTAIMGSVMGAGSVTVLYLEATFGWRNLESSKFVSAISMVRVLVLVVLFPIFNYFFRVRPARQAQRETGIVPEEKNQGADKLDIWILRVALISDVIGVTGYIFVRTQELFVMCAVIAAFGGLGSATIQAAMTKHVPAERVGQLLGATGLLHALSRIVFPALFNGLYALTVRVFPQAFFVMLSTIFFMTLAASFLIRAHGMYYPREVNWADYFTYIIDSLHGGYAVDSQLTYAVTYRRCCKRGDYRGGRADPGSSLKTDTYLALVLESLSRHISPFQTYLHTWF